MNISLITMTQGNPVALKRTIDSLKEICNDFVVGDLCVFDSDKKKIRGIDATIIPLPFDYILHNGFSNTLNTLAEFAKNDLCIYLNVGEIFDGSIAPIEHVISEEYNCYYIDHATERHRWFRVWNRREMQWSGLIHEEITGEFRPYHKPLFRFADTEKDMQDEYKANVYNDIKEMCYWNQLTRIVDDPSLLGATNEGWLRFAKDNYDSMNDRLAAKGERYISFIKGDRERYLAVAAMSDFGKEVFESSEKIEYQGDPLFLGKK